MTKICKVCGNEKLLTQFPKQWSGRKSGAVVIGREKTCHNCLYKRRGYISIKEKFNDGEKRCTKCKAIKSYKEFSKNKVGRFGLNSSCRECKKEYELTPERIKKRKEYKKRHHQKFKDNPEYKLRNALHTRLRKIITEKRNTPMTIEYLGCDIKTFIKHIEKQFMGGMNWNNYGKDGWELDHILPCNSFDMTNKAEVKTCFNYRNIRPLWFKDNNYKRARIEQGSEQIKLVI